MLETMGEILRIAEFAINNPQADRLHFRKALINISNLAYAEISAGGLPLKEDR